MLPGGLTDDDYRILEFIAERDMIVDPKIVTANLHDIKDQRVRNRLQALLRNGLLKRPDDVPAGIDERGLYEATELGKAFATGDKTISELRELAREFEGE